jgi:hypothetical protein
LLPLYYHDAALSSARKKQSAKGDPPAYTIKTSAKSFSSVKARFRFICTISTKDST